MHTAVKWDEFECLKTKSDGFHCSTTKDKKLQNATYRIMLVIKIHDLKCQQIKNIYNVKWVKSVFIKYKQKEWIPILFLEKDTLKC